MCHDGLLAAYIDGLAA